MGTLTKNQWTKKHPCRPSARWSEGAFFLLIGAGRVLLLAGTASISLLAAPSESWIELRTPNFVVVTNANEKAARRVGYQFESIRTVFRQFFNLKGSATAPPVIIVAAKDENTLKSLLPEFWAKKGSAHPAGIYLDGPEKKYVGLCLDVTMSPDAPEPFEPVYHEYIHYLTRGMISRLPLWLTEGLAEFYGNTRIEGKQAYVGAYSATNLMVLRQNPPLPLATLFHADAKSPYYHEENKTSIFYAESWALTHYLVTRDWHDKTHRTSDFIALLEGNTPEEAARRTIGDLATLEKALYLYIGHVTFAAVKMDIPPNNEEEQSAPRALSAAESLAVRGDFMAHDRQFTEAQGMLEQALKLDPKLAAANESMGFVCAQQDKREEAGKWYAQAVALNTQSYLAHYYYAANLLKGSLDGPQAATAETSLRAAIRLNPGFAPAYDALCWLLASRPGSENAPERLEEAHRMGLMASELEPGNVHYRLNSVLVLERLGRVDDAVRVADLASSMARTPEEQSAALSVLMNAEQYRDFQKQVEERRLAVEKRNAELAAMPATPPSDSAEPEDTHAPVLRRRDGEPAGRGVPLSIPVQHPTHPEVLSTLRLAEGTIKTSVCNGPSLDFTLISNSGTVTLYSDKYMSITYRALNYTPEGVLNPCSDLIGRHARVTYHPAKGAPNTGEAIGVDLIKK